MNRFVKNLRVLLLLPLFLIFSCTVPEALKPKKVKPGTPVNAQDRARKNIEDLTDKLFQMVKVVPQNKYCGLAKPEDVMKFKKSDADSLKLNDPKIPTISKLKSNVIELEESALSNKLIKNSEGAEISYTHNSYYLLGSNG